MTHVLAYQHFAGGHGLHGRRLRLDRAGAQYLCRRRSSRRRWTKLCLGLNALLGIGDGAGAGIYRHLRRSGHLVGTCRCWSARCCLDCCCSACACRLKRGAQVSAPHKAARARRRCRRASGFLPRLAALWHLRNDERQLGISLHDAKPRSEHHLGLPGPDGLLGHGNRRAHSLRRHRTMVSREPHLPGFAALWSQLPSSSSRSFRRAIRPWHSVLWIGGTWLLSAAAVDHQLRSERIDQHRRFGCRRHDRLLPDRIRHRELSASAHCKNGPAWSLNHHLWREQRLWHWSWRRYPLSLTRHQIAPALSGRYEPT